MAAYDSIASQFGIEPTILITVFFIALTWKLFWYGLAIYKAIEKKDKTWFVVLFMGIFLLTFFINDLGILAIIYLIMQRKNSKKNKSKK